MSENRPATRDSLPDLPISAVTLHAVASKMRTQFERSEFIRLGLLVAAAGVSVATSVARVGGTDLVIGPAIAGMLLLSSFVLDLVTKESQPRATWLKAFQLEKRIEALAWQYAVGGHVYSRQLPQQEVDDRFNVELVKILKECEVPSAGIQSLFGAQIPDSLRSSRTRDRMERAELYIRRLREAIAELGREMSSLERRGRHATWTARACQAATLILAAGQAIGMLSVSLVGLGATLTASILAWRTVSAPLGITREFMRVSGELLLILNQAEKASDEQSLSAIVDKGEETLLEHVERRLALIE